ncbi:MAG: hypothetical protein U0941_03500 [Planctomycetaceae bacterium]
MVIAVGRFMALAVVAMIVATISTIFWPVDSPEQKLISSGAKLCYALNETLLVGAKLEGDDFGDDEVIIAASIPSMQRLSLAGSSVTARGIQALQSLPKLSSLDLSETDLADDAISELCALSSVRELELNRCRWLKDADLSRLSQMKSLEFLSLNETSISAVGLAQLGQFSALKLVRLERCQQINDSAIDAIVSLCGGRNVNIDLSGTEVTHEGFIKLSTLVPQGKIQLHPDMLVEFRDIAQRGQCFLGLDGKLVGFRSRRDLDGLTISLIPGDLELIAKNAEIRELYLEQSGVTDAMLFELPPLQKLDTLRLSGTPVTDDGLKVLSGFPNLKSLWLMDTNIRGPGLSNLSHVSRLMNLKIQTRHGDEVLQYLTPLKDLTSLSISAPLTDRGFEFLATLPKLESLGLVDMEYSRSGIARLSASSSLKRLQFDGGSINDSDMDFLAKLTRITEVTLVQTRVSHTGRNRLTQLRPDILLVLPRDALMSRAVVGR